MTHHGVSVISLAVFAAGNDEEVRPQEAWRLTNLTARFFKMLYPSAYVENTGFEKSTAPDNFFDLVISNIPFGQFKIDGYNIHNYFFANGIDKVRPGGLMVFITSQGSLASGQDAAKMRSYLAGKADMIAAYKLPSGAFSEAGTGVITDIVIMQKRGKDNVTSKTRSGFPVHGRGLRWLWIWRQH